MMNIIIHVENKDNNKLKNNIMGKTTIREGNPHPDRMPSTTGNPSGGGRSNNPPKK